MNDLTRLTELEESILRYLSSRSHSYERIEEKFVSEGVDEQLVAMAIDTLYKNKHYITIKRLMKVGFYSFDQEITENDQENCYAITSLGKNYLANTARNFASFSNIINSNVANNSLGAKQTINLSSQSQNIQNKVEELQSAVKYKDSSRIKKIFGYIADKSIDVAIAILTGGLTK